MPLPDRQFLSDWLFTPGQSEEIVSALGIGGKDVTYCNIQSSYGHDAFLLETEKLGAILEGFIGSMQQHVRTGSGLRPGTRMHTRTHKPHERFKRVRVDYELIDSLIDPAAACWTSAAATANCSPAWSKTKNIRAEGSSWTKTGDRCVQRGLSARARCRARTGPSTRRGLRLCRLSQTIQTLRDPQKVIQELHRAPQGGCQAFRTLRTARRMQLMFEGMRRRRDNCPSLVQIRPTSISCRFAISTGSVTISGSRSKRRLPLGKRSAQPLSSGQTCWPRKPSTSPPQVENNQ